jgi:glycosyltransferase involved in cell wall biosynthesis
VPYGFIKSKMVRFYISRRKIYNQIKEINIDLVFVLSDLWAQECSRYYRSQKSVPYVVRLRANPKRVRKAIGTSWAKERILNYLEVRSLKHADLIIPNSKDLAKKTEEWGVPKEKITEPIYNGVDTHMFKPMNVEKSSEFTVAYAGRVSPEKGIYRLVRIAEKLPDVHFLIAGKRQMGISFPRAIEYVGGLPFSEMPKFYNKADLIILPSFTEGFPNVILEAYACGKPVLVAREAFPQELEVFGSVADSNRLDIEIEALQNLDLVTVGLEARSHVKKHYTWERFGQSIIEHLRAVVEQPKKAMQP